MTVFGEVVNHPRITEDIFVLNFVTTKQYMQH